MILPAAAFIEMAADSLKDVSAAELSVMAGEFRAFGQARMDRVLPDHTTLTPEARGYLLGLQTARVLLKGIPGNTIDL